jgi:hypothetical protein
MADALAATDAKIKAAVKMRFIEYPLVAMLWTPKAIAGKSGANGTFTMEHF